MRAYVYALLLFLSGVLFVALAITSSGFSQTTSADFYVATNGNDTWPGTLSQPFRTVDRARLAVQSLKTQVSNRTITVLIRNGTYYLPATWTFTSVDSGTSTTPILYANYPGEKPVISGGRLLTNWVQNANGQWQTNQPVGTYFTQLWVNGARRYRPRTTPGSYLYITGEFSTTGSTTAVNQLSYAAPPTGGVPATMANLGDVELIVFEAWDVAHLRISSVNTSTRRITTTTSLTKDRIYLGFIPGHHFLIENVKEALKQPGQFYLDRPTGLLTYIPMAGELLSSASIVAPRLQKILTATNLSFVTFQGLTFAHSDWQVPTNGYTGSQAEASTPAAISLTNSTGVVFRGVTITHTGAYGIEFLGPGITGGSSPYMAQFRDGLVYDTGAGAVRVGTKVSTCNTDTTVPHDVYVGNNLITGGGRVLAVGFGILVGDAHHIMVEHNEISDFYNNGIGVGFNWNYGCNRAHDDVVQFNHIHHLGQGVTSDLGGVYFLSGLNSGNKILNNKVHHISHDPAGYGGWGLYTDQGAMGVLVQNNLVYRTTDASLHVNHATIAPPAGTPPNLFKNNILAYGSMGAMARHNDTTFLSFSLQNNIFYYDKQTIQQGYWYCQGKTFCTDYFRFDNNLYFHRNLASGQPVYPFFKTPYTAPNTVEQPQMSWLTFQQWQSLGEDVHSRFADPLFANPTADNYTLSSSSPAFNLGFVAFDPNQAGRTTTTLTAPAIAAGYPALTSGVFVISPSAGATYTNPVQFVAYATGASTITSMKIYVDGVSRFSTSGSSLKTSLTLSTGTRNITMQAWDSAGKLYQLAETISVK